VRGILLVVSCAWLWPSPGGLAAQAEVRWDGDQRAIAELIERTAAANNAGDVEGWVALFADDAVYLPPGGPAVTTRRGLVEVAEAGFRHRADIRIDPLEIVVTGPWAYARNSVRGTVTVDGTGETVAVDVRQLVIYHRAESGEWRIARLIGNRSS
jgi:uncharacterized protein (TIGR02246 family)